MATGVVALLALTLSAPPTVAQQLAVTGSLCLEQAGSPATAAPAPATSCPTTTFSVALSDVRVAGSTVGLELSYLAGAVDPVPVGAPASDPAPGKGAVQLGLSLAANETFGPLGNVVFELDGDLRTDALAQLTLVARGVLGPVAARIDLGAYGADAAAFDPLAVAADERPTLGGPAVGLRLGLTGRLSRNVVLEASPELYRSAAGLSGRLATRLRLVRALGENELRVLLRAGATPGFASAYGAVGAGVSFPRGRAPDLDFAVHLGLRDGRLAPGVTLNLAENLSAGVKTGLMAAYEPYRSDVHPGRALGSVSLPLGDGTLELALAGAFLDPVRPAAATVSTSYRLPVKLP